MQCYAYHFRGVHYVYYNLKLQNRSTHLMAIVCKHLIVRLSSDLVHTR